MFARALVLASTIALAAAQLKVLAPGGPNLWWVADSVNNIVWNCKESQVQNFTIVLTNSNTSILSGNLAIIAIENNFDCSKTITTQQANLPAASGYTVQLANPLNNTDVYAESDVFEVKPLGAAYPATSATPSDTPTSTGSSSSSSGTSSPQSSNNGAFGVSPRSTGALGVLLIGAAAFLAL